MRETKHLTRNKQGQQKRCLAQSEIKKCNQDHRKHPDPSVILIKREQGISHTDRSGANMLTVGLDNFKHTVAFLCNA